MGETRFLRFLVLTAFVLFVLSACVVPTVGQAAQSRGGKLSPETPLPTTRSKGNVWSVLGALSGTGNVHRAPTGNLTAPTAAPARPAAAFQPPTEPPRVVGAGRNAGFFVMSAQEAIEHAVQTGALTPPAPGLAPDGTAEYVEVPTICVIYASYYHNDGCQVHLTPEEVAVVIAEIEKAREFLWRASGLRYHMKNDYLVIGDDPGERTLTPEMMWSWEPNAYWLPFWSCDGVTSVEQDLYDAGIVNDQYSVVVVTYAFQNCDTAWTPIGGGTYGVGVGCMGKAAYIGDPMAWGLEVEGVTEHEYLHAIDGIFEASGNPLGNDMFSADQAGDFPYAVDCGQHFNFVLCQVLDPASWLLLDPWYATLQTCPDADNDGVPDVGDVPITEATLGTSTSDADSDDDGLSDFGEMVAAFHAAADPLNADTDGDGVIDGVDDYPLWNFSPVAAPGSPTIDGVINPGEYTETARYNVGDPDLGVIVYTSWAEGVLSIAADVDDDMLSTYYDDPWWVDNVEIRIDAQKDGWEFEHGDQDYRLGIVPRSASGSGDEPFMAGENHSGSWPVDTSVITAKFALRPGGYVIEASIPEAAFPGVSFAEGEPVRLTFNVEDYDEWPGWPCYNLMTKTDDDRPGFVLLWMGTRPRTAPTAFDLTAPPSGSIYVDADLWPAWNKSFPTAADETVTYRLLVDDNGDFSSPEILVEGLTETTYHVTAADGLALGEYHWMVEAVTNFGMVRPSTSVRTFVLAADDDDDDLPDFWEQQIVDADPDDAIEDIGDVLPDDDYDGDGLTNRLEYDNKTDPTNPDTDGDGLTDGDEVHAYGSDPLDTDTDDDGLDDGTEASVHGTNPCKADTDDDTMPDGWEIAFGLDPLVDDAGLDLDGDGLVNGDECSRGANPTDPDTDDDGLTDGDEVHVYWCNPLDPDSDDDGLSDGDEVLVHGTDPSNGDSDGDGLSDGDEVNVYLTSPTDDDTDDDGMRDGWEVAYGLDPFLDDAGGDLDGDGLTNRDEHDRGTDPTNADTDGDGLTDYEEGHVYWTDPLDPDYDDDGLSDGDEVLVYGTQPRYWDSDYDRLGDGDEVNVYGTDPHDRDTDDDTMRDGYETDNALDPLDPADAARDADGDLLLNAEECDIDSSASDPFSPTFIYVDDDNAGDPAQDGSLEHPYETIQAGISASSWDTVVRVLPGTYVEYVTPKSDVWLLGSGPERTRVTSPGGPAMWLVNVWSVHVAGFTFDDNPGSTQLDARYSDAVMRDCVFTGAKNGLVVEYWGSLTLRNCLIAGNTGRGLWAGGTASVKLLNCTVADNAGGGAAFMGENSAELVNTIIWGNGEDVTFSDTATLSVTCCDVGDGTFDGANGNTSADPLFVAGPRHNYFLSQTAAGQICDSPCFDAGDGTLAACRVDLSTTRTDGVPDTCQVDMGYHVRRSTQITDVWWDQPATSVRLVFTTEPDADYTVECADADQYDDGLAWSVLADVTATSGTYDLSDDLSAKPLSGAFRFYRVRRNDTSELSTQTAAVFELALDAAAAPLYFISTPLMPDPDHASVREVFGEGEARQIARDELQVSDLNETVGALSRMQYDADGRFVVTAGKEFSLEPCVGYELVMGSGPAEIYTLRLTGYVPAEACLRAPLTKCGAQALRWMAYSMPRPIGLADLGLETAVTRWLRHNRVRLLPPGSSRWVNYHYNSVGGYWYNLAVPGVPANPTIECGMGIVFLRVGPPDPTGALMSPKWYTTPPNEW